MNNLHFLSQEIFRYKEDVIKVCQNHLKVLSNNEDKDIIENILKDFLLNDFTFLSQQEVNFLKLNDKNKWVDYIIYRWKFKNYGKMKKIPKFPLYLIVEPTSICNLRCSMCFQSDESFSSNKEFMGKMDFKLFTKIIDEAVVGGTKALTLASRGEPTIHPLFCDMLQYCTDKFYDIKINTNALMLNTELIHQILNSKVGIVVFSVDAHDSEGYKKIRNSNDFNRVVEKIKEFHNIREKYYPNSKVISRAHGVKVFKDYNDEKFYSFWKGITDEVTFIECVSRWDAYNNPKNSRSEPCSVAFDRMYIWYDGICNPCDFDYKSYLAIGNVMNQSIAEIWNGSKFERIRQTHLNGERSTLFPCDRCEL